MQVALLVLLVLLRRLILLVLLALLVLPVLWTVDCGLWTVEWAGGFRQRPPRGPVLTSQGASAQSSDLSQLSECLFGFGILPSVDTKHSPHTRARSDAQKQHKPLHRVT